MPRGSRGSSRSPSRSATTTSIPSRPAPSATAAPTSSAGSGLLGTMAQGMAFGAGSAVAHQAVRSFFGGSSHQTEGAPQQSEQQIACKAEMDNFTNCLKSNAQNISLCQPFNDVFKMCKEGSK